MTASAPIRTILVDDEPLARASLESLLDRDSSFERVGSYGDARAAFAVVQHDPPDLLFLDIKMPRLSGFEFLAALRDAIPRARRPYAILVTAFDRFALQAFEYEALDYLVKPVDSDRFAATLTRAKERIETRRLVSTERAQSAAPDRIAFEAGGRAIWLDPATIDWIEASDHYLLIHTHTRSHFVRYTLAAAERILAPYRFLRVHRGALVNPLAIESRESTGDGRATLTLREGVTLHVSRRRWPALREHLEKGPPTRDNPALPPR